MARSTALLSSVARQRAGEIVTEETTKEAGGGDGRAERRGTDANQLVDGEVPAAIGARDQDHARRTEDGVRFTVLPASQYRQWKKRGTYRP